MGRETAAVLSAVLICPYRGLSSAFHTACADIRELRFAAELSEYPSVAALDQMLATQQIEAIFLDVKSDRATALQLIGHLRKIAPETAVAGLDEANNPEVILQCLRGGAAEFLASPFPLEEVRHAVRRMLQHSGAAARRPASKRGRIHVFAPVKGGSGATTLAYTAAFQIRKQTRGTVLLADLHLVGGVVAFLAKIRPTYSAVDALKHASQLDEAVWKSLVSEKGGIDILAAPDRPEPALIEPYPVQELLEFSRGLYDHVVVDLGSILDPLGMTAINASDETNLVCSTDMTSLFLMRRMIPVLEEMGRRMDQLNVLVNRTDRKRDLSSEELERIFRASIHRTFPDDPIAVEKAQREGEPLPETSDLGKTIRSYVQGILGEAGATPANGRLGALKQLWGGA
jgi:pilus assembly protein CpaE